LEERDSAIVQTLRRAFGPEKEGGRDGERDYRRLVNIVRGYSWFVTMSYLGASEAGCDVRDM